LKDTGMKRIRIIIPTLIGSVLPLSIINLNTLLSEYFFISLRTD